MQVLPCKFLVAGIYVTGLLSFLARNNNNDNTCIVQVRDESSGRVLLALIFLFTIYTS